MKNKNAKIDPEIEKAEPYLLQLSQKAVIYDPEAKRYLLVKDVDESSFFARKYGPWEFVGGRLVLDETLAENLEREIEEEIGKVNCDAVDILDAVEIEYRTGKAIAVGYLVFYQGGEISLSPEHKEMKWMSAKEIEESDFKPWVKKLVEKAERRLEEREYLNGWKRCQADFENFKKRREEEKKDIISYANERMILEILPVLDNFHISTAHIPDDQKDNPWVTGIMHIRHQMEKVLKENGVEEIAVKPGDEFDPAVHEAVKSDSGEKNSDDKVKKVLQKGYRLKDKVIRPARVAVG